MAARSPARISAGSPGQRASSEQCRFCTVIPRPAFRSPADTTRYCESISGNTICRVLSRDVLSGPRRNSSGRHSRNRCTMRKISSAASWVCATSSVSVPGRVIVRRKNRAAAQVVNPICRAFRTMFCLPRRRSNSLCAAFARNPAVRPSRVLTFRSRAASSMATVRPAQTRRPADPESCPAALTRAGRVLPPMMPQLLVTDTLPLPLLQSGLEGGISASRSLPGCKNSLPK